MELDDSPCKFNKSEIQETESKFKKNFQTNIQTNNHKQDLQANT